MMPEQEQFAAGRVPAGARASPLGKGEVVSEFSVLSNPNRPRPYLRFDLDFVRRRFVIRRLIHVTRAREAVRIHRNVRRAAAGANARRHAVRHTDMALPE